MQVDEFDEPSKLMKGIELYFGTDLDRWLACFDPPFAFVTPEATTVARDESTARRQFGPAFEALQAAGFASSVAESVTTKYAGPDLAFVDASFKRAHRDGTFMGRAAALYVCRRRGSQWRIAAVIQHPPESPVLPVG